MTDIIVKDIKNGSEYYYGGSAEVSAEDVSYDNTTSWLTATDVQDAIDEVAQSIPTTWQLLIGNIHYGRKFWSSDTEGYLIGKASTYAKWVYASNGSPKYLTNLYATGNGFIDKWIYYTLWATSPTTNNSFYKVNLGTGETTTSAVEYAYKDYDYIFIVDDYIYGAMSATGSNVKKFDLNFNYIEDVTLAHWYPDIVYKDKLYYITIQNQVATISVENIDGTVVKTINDLYFSDKSFVYIYNDLIYTLINDTSHPIFMPVATI